MKFKGFQIGGPFLIQNFTGREVPLMATRGRKPTPTAIKDLEGNPGKRKLNENEPKPEKKAPACPKWLSKDARKEWHRLPRSFMRGRMP